METIHRNNYRIFGIEICSSYPFSTSPTNFSGPPEIEFIVVPKQQTISKNPEYIYTSPFRDINGLNHFRLFRSHGNFVIRLSTGIDFEFIGNQIVCSSEDPYDPIIEIGFLGAVLAFWLEVHQIMALHASAVKANNHSIIFLAESLSGKSSLAASFIQAGFPLLSDDIVPIELVENRFFCRPGYPMMKLWPDEASFLFGDTHAFEKENPRSEKIKIPIGPNGLGHFAASSIPVGCLYLPERTNNPDFEREVQITSISPRDSVVEILRFSFAARMAEAAGYAASRLEMISKIARSVPIKRLIYPSGYQYLPMVREAILTDLSQTITLF